MKSLLVDALRQANTGDTGTSVSDSGSFETAEADSEFGATANDEVIDSREPDEEELELLTSTGVLVVGEDVADSSVDPSIKFSRLNDSAAQLSISRGHHPHVTAPESVPVLARYAPLICIVLAIVAAGSWLLYQQIEVRYFHGVFDSSLTDANANGAAIETADAALNVERFPFINVPTETSDVAGASP